VDLYTLNRGFIRQSAIDAFESAIWTERYYGDSEVELIVPATPEMFKKLPIGAFLGLSGSNEIMMLETHDVDKGVLKINGISLMKWLNNRFIRATPAHEDRYWNLTGQAGWVLWAIIYYMCISGQYPLGVGNPADFVIPGLGLKDYDKTGSNITVAVPYGPLYDAMKSIGTTYQVGMSITLESATDTAYSIQFRSYRGLNRTSAQSDNPVVRFSPQMDSLTKIKELQSIANYKTRVYSFAPSNPGGMATTPGYATVVNPGTPSTGFDMRAMLVFADDLTTDNVGGDANVLLSALNQRANIALQDNKFAKYVDGEIVPTSQFKYGLHYSLGDIIEVQGNSGVTQNARVTEYIRAQDQAGERAYPTVSMID
jgi:Siphovirus ReqiPepy6 Gp37-like protein